jgi:hypothetical protein
MNYTASDTKLITLIKLCKETLNYKTLAVVSFILVSNTADEIGFKLAIRPRNKEGNEPIFRYLALINSLLKKNYRMLLFKEDWVQRLQEIEPLFIKMKGDIPLPEIFEVYEIYFELRKLEIPNLYKKVDADMLSEDKNLQLYTLFSHPAASQKNDKLKSLMVHNLEMKQREVQKQLQQQYNKDLFEQAIYLKKAQASIKTQKSGKIVLKGRLADNIVYQNTMEELYGYFFIGAFLLFLMFGLIITYECMLHPSLVGAFSYFFLITYGTSMFFFLLYWHYYKKGDEPE